jgi:hypothetical protein
VLNPLLHEIERTRDEKIMVSVAIVVLASSCHAAAHRRPPPSNIEFVRIGTQLLLWPSRAGAGTAEEVDLVFFYTAQVTHSFFPCSASPLAISTRRQKLATVLASLPNSSRPRYRLHLY